MSEINEWELSSGLPLDGMVGTITKATVAPNAKREGAPTVFLTITPDNGGEDVEQWFSVGKGHDCSRDGDELISDTPGKPRAINNRTTFGVFIASVLNVLGDKAPTELGGSPKLMSTWEGTKWTFGTVTEKFNDPTTGEPKESSKVVVREYHGRDGAGAAGAAGGAKGAAAKGATADADTPLPGFSDELWAKVKELADAHDDFQEFSDAALDLPGVADDDKVEKALMNKRAGSAWAVLKG